MKHLIALLAALFMGVASPVALAEVSTVTTPGLWDLYSGTTKKSSSATEAACIAAVQALNVTGTYRCTTSTGVVTTLVVTDLCPNLTGIQTTVPAGMVKDTAGNCVIANITWTRVAEEDAPFTLAATSTIRYGLPGTYFQKDLVAGAYTCGNTLFGDPIPGAWKYCDSSTPSTTIDVCPNIAGVQTAIPTGMIKDTAGNCVIPPVTPPPPSSAIGTWQGMTAAMWAEVATQRAAFGDPNNCKARVDAIPTTGVSVAPGGNIQATVNANRTTVLLAGTHSITAPITVPTGKFLIGAPGATVTINARGSDRGVYLAGGAAVANVIVDGAVTFGVLAFSSAGYTSNNTIYNVSVRHTGYYSTTSGGGSGILISTTANNNCIVSSDVSNTWNETGGSNALGGNADGVNNSFGASNNSFIDVVSYKNGDDGLDMWQGGQMYCYFCNMHDNGKVDGKNNQGDGNGIKLGTGSVSHKFYKSTANNNRTGGFNLNGNTQQPTLVQSTATGNPSGNYINGVNAP